MRTQTTSYFARLFAGDLSAFGGPVTDEAVAGHIRAEQMSLVLGYSVGIMLAKACNAAVLVVAQWHSPDLKLALIWAVIVAGAAIAFGLQSHAARRITKPQFVSRRAMHRLVRNAFILGAAWGTVPVAFFADASTGGQLVITCLCSGMLAGGALAFATIPIAAIAFTAPIFAGIAICRQEWRSGVSADRLPGGGLRIGAAAQRVRQFGLVRTARDAADRGRAFGAAGPADPSA